MDELAAYNRERWNALVDAGVEYSKPWLDLTPDTARQRLDKRNWLGDVVDKDVLCLANGGGQQSAAFAMLGAHCTVFDLSDAQLANDRRTADHHGLAVRIEQGDMRDLSRFADDAFDLVWQAYSINFVPDPERVFDEVQRVLKPGGRYVLDFSNPHRFSIPKDTWVPDVGYGLMLPYRDGEIYQDDGMWDVEQPDGRWAKVRGPREFSHTWGKLINALAGRNFMIQHCSEWMRETPNAEVGSWPHYTQTMPPYITYWMRLIIPAVASQ